MLKKDVVKFFTSQTRLSKALGFKSTGAVSQWGEVIPEKQALRLEKITEGALRYDPELYEPVQESPAA